VKYLCESCDRLAEPASLRREAGALVLSCSKCGAETRAAWAEAQAEPAAAAVPRASAPAPSSPRVVTLHAVPPMGSAGEDPFTVPEDRCPKCVAPRPEGALSCHGCGLVFANFVAAESTPSDELQAAWKDLTSHWGDVAAHDRVLAAAAVRGDLAAAGRLYRIRLARQPRDPLAVRGRDEVLRLAATTSPLLSEPPPVNPDQAKKVLSVVAAMFLLFSLLVVSYWVFARR
jgi:hypothetical protein